MTANYQESPLWKRVFPPTHDQYRSQRGQVITAYEKFRGRVELLVGEIHKDLPNLTVHDITHIDSLWWIASEIAGEEVPLNPAEALVLGGAFLLHDAAHCLAAFPGGVEEVKSLPEWSDFASLMGYGKEDLLPKSEQFQFVLFQVLRVMHPKQARRLAKLHWKAPGDSEPLFLFPDDELRLAYADAIGRVAHSHWLSPHELEGFKDVTVTAPACLSPASWTVDLFKIAILLRTADAAHIDSRRAPRFLSALVKPSGLSLLHWQFQTKLNQPTLDEDKSRHDLLITGAPFSAKEQEAWWLAYDAARMIDNELRAADRLLLDSRKFRLAARSVASSYSSDAFSRNVPAEDWQPVDTSIKITDIRAMVERFGGEKLYGDNKRSALRELLQNAVDSIRACRALGGLGDEEGEITVELEDGDGTGDWLHVTDTGIGMSRYVLTDVLLDFGKSLWRSADLRGEWDGLSATRFEAIGQFGIGFFSVFMLGEYVRVITKRFEAKEGEHPQWLLEFTAGAQKRPILREPRANERLKRHGTKVSVRLVPGVKRQLTPTEINWDDPGTIYTLSLESIVAQLAPAVDINIFVAAGGKLRNRVVAANDWRDLPPLQLLQRVNPVVFDSKSETAFGYWSHVSEIYDAAGTLQGRLAVSKETRFHGNRNGISVVKGLFAGPCEGVAGIIFAQPQADLARASALPNLTLEQIRHWAIEQQNQLAKHGRLDEDNSVALAAFGADGEKLVIGKLAGAAVNVEELRLALSDMHQLIRVEGDVAYDEDDGVLEKDFRNAFEPGEGLLEESKHTAPAWLKQVSGYQDFAASWSIRASLRRALQSLADDAEGYLDDRSVGQVNGVEIVRACRVTEIVDEDAE